MERSKLSADDGTLSRYLVLLTVRSKSQVMFVTLSVLASLISIMFVASIASTISELRREREEMKVFAARRVTF